MNQNDKNWASLKMVPSNLWGMMAGMPDLVTKTNDTDTMYTKIAKRFESTPPVRGEDLRYRRLARRYCSAKLIQQIKDEDNRDAYIISYHKSPIITFYESHYHIKAQHYVNWQDVCMLRQILPNLQDDRKGNYNMLEHISVRSFAYPRHFEPNEEVPYPDYNYMLNGYYVNLRDDTNFTYDHKPVDIKSLPPVYKYNIDRSKFKQEKIDRINPQLISEMVALAKLKPRQWTDKDMSAHIDAHFDLDNFQTSKKPYDRLAGLISRGFDTELFDSGRYEQGNGYSYTFIPSGVQQLLSNSIKATSQHCLKPIQYENRARLHSGHLNEESNFNKHWSILKVTPIKKESTDAKSI